jgi:hypothetical protein
MQQVDKKRTLQSTFVLLAAMLASSPRGEGEEMFQPIAEAMLGVGGPLNDTVSELTDQGYLDRDDQGRVIVTPFGQKIALQSTSNTPNFRRLATQSPNTAFAMFFASFGELRDKHLVNQEKIVAGNNGNLLVTNLHEVVNFFDSRLSTNKPVITKAKTAKKLDQE